MDPDRQTGSASSLISVADQPAVGQPAAALSKELIAETEEEPDSPMADRLTALGSTAPSPLPADLIGPLLGSVIALLAITLPLLSVLTDRRPGFSQAEILLPASLSERAGPP